MAREPVPEQLDLVAKELLAPLHGIFHHLVQQVSLIQFDYVAVMAHRPIILNSYQIVCTHKSFLRISIQAQGSDNRLQEAILS